jgi:hypothetical protein
MFRTEVVGEIKHTFCGKQLFWGGGLEYHAVCEIIWKNCRAGRPQVTIWRMHIACWIAQAANTQYVIVIAFPLQQWLQERTSNLRYFYIAYVLYNWPVTCTDFFVLNSV